MLESAAVNFGNCGGVDVNGLTNAATTWMWKSCEGARWAKFLCTGSTVFSDAMDGKELLWLCLFFAYMDLGKGREQDAEAFRKKK